MFGLWRGANGRGVGAKGFHARAEKKPGADADAVRRDEAEWQKKSVLVDGHSMATKEARQRRWRLFVQRDSDCATSGSLCGRDLMKRRLVGGF